jgi:hypothetical protein
MSATFHAPVRKYREWIEGPLKRDPCNPDLIIGGYFSGNIPDSLFELILRLPLASMTP